LYDQFGAPFARLGIEIDGWKVAFEHMAGYIAKIRAAQQPSAQRSSGQGFTPDAPASRAATFSMRPARADFETALSKAAAMQIIDPCKTLTAWGCRLYSGAGEQVGFGLGDTPGESAAFAWLHMNDPDILVDGQLHPENWLDCSPYEPNADYRFEVVWTARPHLWFDGPDDPDDDGGEVVDPA
jgi:hypothetical protein